MRPTLLFLPLLASLLLLLHDHASADDCEPAACGNLTLRYPFWLGSSTSSQPPSPCGYPAFEVWCSGDGRVASLKGSSIHVLSIDYTTNSLVACHAKLAGDDGVCKIDFNVSSSIALSLFTISPQNRALCFLYGCNNGTEPSGSEYVNATSHCSAPIYAYLGGDYYWDKPPAIATGGCKYTYMPVLGTEAAIMTAANYSRLLKDGFVLDWEVAGVGDCQACNANGGQCRYDSAAVEFWCLCPDGRRARSTCAGVPEGVTLLEFEQTIPEEVLNQPEEQTEPSGEGDAVEDLPECPDHQPSTFLKDDMLYQGFCKTCLHPAGDED